MIIGSGSQTFLQRWHGAETKCGLGYARLGLLTDSQCNVSIEHTPIRL
uniref:Uncharacterized protein n=1 Tax=Anguilla anguilla TaxID=7936 RepID=A0A0E9PHB8_ANGAN